MSKDVRSACGRRARPAHLRSRLVRQMRLAVGQGFTLGQRSHQHYSHEGKRRCASSQRHGGCVRTPDCRLSVPGWRAGLPVTSPEGYFRTLTRSLSWPACMGSTSGILGSSIFHRHTVSRQSQVGQRFQGCNQQHALPPIARRPQPKHCIALHSEREFHELRVSR
jgi:hypothetical protein